MEPENNDALHISLLKLNYAGQGNKDVRLYGDDHASSNLFQVKNDSRYTWIEGESHLLTYEDKNDANLKIDYEWKGANWETTAEHNREIEKGLREGYAWRYAGDPTNWGLWSKISNYTTDSLNIDLDLATVTELMASSGGWIGLGFDADCHYAAGAVLEITTKTKDVPEPGSLSLMVMGLATLSGAFFIRKRN
ncbi:MAG TPA: PEP-CTERM sorting domain-containing protein [Chitinispirillaceae bacterium]|nr:PEP-CTERM sorting domain-containing protein [Chitinispirillaceae bacterium]